MTTTLDTKLRAAATALLTKYGKSVTWRTIVSTGDPDAGTSMQTTTDYTIRVTPPAPYESRYVDGDLVLSGDTRVYLAAVDVETNFTPKPGDNVVIDNAKWLVVAVAPYYSGDLQSIWEAQLRR